ncbi:MAG: DUF5916 domain-containing protein [Candidatus Omnitrophota bacterium]
MSRHYKLKFKLKFTSVLFILLVLTSLLQAVEKTPLKIPNVEGMPRVNPDGVLDDAIWQKALKLELNYEVRPGENTTPPVKTEVFIAYSKTYLYVGVMAYDPDPSKIRANLTDRDNIADNDWVSIRLDTFNDQRRSYTFKCNPLGIQSDSMDTDSNFDKSWDAIWGSGGRILSNGYAIEMAIPLSSIRFQDKAGEQIWGFNMTRRYPRNFSYYIDFVPWDRNFSCTLCQMAKIIGFEGVKVGKNIELDPSISYLCTQERDEFTNKWVGNKNQLNLGLTAHWGITPNMVLSATANPDFSQVEADSAQLDINTQFALYYEEKRPFFMEGANIFDTRVANWKLYNPVDTRALADPDWGFKLTGKQGPHTIGLFSVQDHLTNILIPGSDGSVATSLITKSIGSVLRYRLDIGQTSTVGFLVTDREGDHYYNRLVGADSYFRINNKKYVKAQFLSTWTSYPTDTRTEFCQSPGVITGSLLDLVFRHEGRNLGYYVTYRQASPGFRADLGYMPHVGYRNTNAVITFSSWKGPGNWYTYMYLTPSVEYETDFDNRLLQKNVKLAYYYEGPHQISYFVEGSLGKKSYNGFIFDISRVRNIFEIQPGANWQFYAGFDFGKQVDFENTRQGANIVFNPGGIWRIGRHFSINLDYIAEWFSVGGESLYTAKVNNLKLIYQFNARAFLRVILQYVDYKYNVDSYTYPMGSQFKSLFSQILFSYKLNPQTMLFLGYSDDSYGREQIRLKQTNRTFFLKIGYALVM